MRRSRQGLIKAYERRASYQVEIEADAEEGFRQISDISGSKRKTFGAVSTTYPLLFQYRG
jgi:hypothetical protein